jgi:hypothetical protein
VSTGRTPCQDCGHTKPVGFGRILCPGCWDARAQSWRLRRTPTILNPAYLEDQFAAYAAQLADAESSRRKVTRIERAS